MAAVLCKPITACLECICTAPCKLCSGGCKLCSDGISGLCTNPLSAFVFITLITQIPLAIAAVLEVGGLFKGCRGSQWLVGMLVVAISHMASSVYLAVRVTNSTDEALRSKHTSWERISYLLCHDPWIAIYLLIVIFFVVWLIVGSAWTVNGSMDNDNGCGSDVNDRVSIVLGLGWFYLFAGPTILSCNLCCVCCDKTDYAGDDEAFAAAEAEKEAKKQQRKGATNSNSNYNSADIENPNPPQEAQAMPKENMKMAPSPPRTYSADGVQISDDGNDRVVRAEVVVESNHLPPAMPPPKDGFNAQAAKVKTEETAAKAQATAGKALKSANEKVGGWFNKKKKKGDDAPERKATLY